MSHGTSGELVSRAREAAAKLFGDSKGQVDGDSVFKATANVVASMGDNSRHLSIRTPLIHGMITAFVHEWSLIVEAASSADGDLMVIYAPAEGLDTTGLVPPEYPNIQ